MKYKQEEHHFNTLAEYNEHEEHESPAEEKAEQEGEKTHTTHVHYVKYPEMNEHDKVRSRTTGRDVEISMGPNGGGLVPANPFASLAQEGYLHAHPEKLGAEKLAEFDRETKGMKLPEHVKKSKK